MRKKVTISDVAKLAKVSKATVSRYLNKKFSLLSKDTVARVEFAIKELNYSPSQIAQSIKRGNTKLIALVVSDINNPYSIELYKGAEKYAFENDYALLLFNTNDNFSRETKILKSLSSYQVEGVIIQSLKMENYILNSYTVPVVSVDREITNYKCDLVSLDNKKSVEIVIEHLINKGFDTLLFVTENIELSQARWARVHYFKESLLTKSNIIGSVLEVDDSSDFLYLKEKFEQFFIAYQDKKIVIISVNGKVAFNLLCLLESMKVECGKDIGFVTFDNPKWSEIVSRGITVLAQPTFEIGYTACKFLIDRINNPFLDRQVVFYIGKLIERNSTQIKMKEVTENGK